MTGKRADEVTVGERVRVRGVAHSRSVVVYTRETPVVLEDGRLLFTGYSKRGDGSVFVARVLDPDEIVSVVP